MAETASATAPSGNTILIDAQTAGPFPLAPLIIELPDSPKEFPEMIIRDRTGSNKESNEIDLLFKKSARFLISRV
jgi:hypothetical protein